MYVHLLVSYVIAGLGAGMTEAILVVTPTETIKYVPLLPQNRTFWRIAFDTCCSVI